MNVGVIGLGYVGVTTAVCMAKLGHTVMGTDIDATKINKLHSSRSPVPAAGVEELLMQLDVKANLYFTVKLDMLIKNSEVIMICVGTPEAEDGGVDLSQVKKVFKDLFVDYDIATSLFKKTIILRSTVPPGTCIKLLNESFPCGENEVVQFQLLHNPEFLREAHAVEDFMNPPIIVAGCDTNNVSEKDLNYYISKLFYGALPREAGKIFIVNYSTSELLKYANNAFHALKIVFANEIAIIAEAHGVDGNRLMELLCEDKKLNISSAYLHPGLPYGGHCLPKDVEALLTLAFNKKIQIPMLEGMDDSNIAHIKYLANSDVAIEK